MLFENSTLVGCYAMSTDKLVTDALKYGSTGNFSSHHSRLLKGEFSYTVDSVHKERDKTLFHPAIIERREVPRFFDNCYVNKTIMHPQNTDGS
jgi:hypothetical protein